MRVLILSLSNTQQHTILSFLPFFSYSKLGKTPNYAIPLLLFYTSFFFFFFFFFFLFFFCFTRLRANLQFQSSFSLIYVSTNCTSTPHSIHLLIFLLLNLLRSKPQTLHRIPPFLRLYTLSISYVLRILCQICAGLSDEFVLVCLSLLH
ncbi:hypothetical protein VNO80_21971 [Phaseolus coccineus]|uniref:Uncharacterized protein n=1 Tax=Phaseolus coccineus TaxID=3886 RepID=A0AAN9M4U2_PHACN